MGVDGQLGEKEKRRAGERRRTFELQHRASETLRRFSTRHSLALTEQKVVHPSLQHKECLLSLRRRAAFN